MKEGISSINLLQSQLNRFIYNLEFRKRRRICFFDTKDVNYYPKDTSIPKDSGILYESTYLCMMGPAKEHRSKEACTASLNAVKDALYVLNGKWKLPLIISLQEGPQRFNEIQKSLGEITPKILSKELKDLELNEFVIRKVFSTTPVTVTYELTPYSESLDKVIFELREWGLKHRERLVKSRRTEKELEPVSA